MAKTYEQAPWTSIRDWSLGPTRSLLRGKQLKHISQKSFTSWFMAPRQQFFSMPCQKLLHMCIINPCIHANPLVINIVDVRVKHASVMIYATKQT